MPKSVYSKILNRYVRPDHPILKKQPYYWNQGIGQTEAIPTVEEPETGCVFDYTFDSTFCNGDIVETGVFDNTFDITFN
jgi:hypothetical protein